LNRQARQERQEMQKSTTFILAALAVSFILLGGVLCVLVVQFEVFLRLGDFA
jgi:hypothetical protein